MRHTITIDGYKYRLRPVKLEDAQFIIDLRTGDPEYSKYLNPTSPDITLQLLWLEDYFKRNNDYYFVIENKINNESEGLVAIYNIKNNKGEGGRLIVRKNSLAAVEGWYLLYRVAFEILNLQEVYSGVLLDNKKVVSFHKSFKEKTREIKPYNLNGIIYNSIEFYVEKDYFFSIIQPEVEKLTKSIYGKKENNE